MSRLQTAQVLCGVSLMLVAGAESASGEGLVPSYSPRENFLKIWEPCLWDVKTPITPGPGNEIVNAITAAMSNTQGYTVIRYPDTKKDDSYEKCTRKNWEAFAEGAGVAYMNTHGRKGVVVPVVAGTAKPKVPDADKYIRQWAEAPGTDWGDIRFDWWPKKKVWACEVQSKWFTRNWRNTFNANRSIVVIEACRSAKGSESVVKSCGGRIGFGYRGKVTDDDGIHNNGWLFGRMNGTRDDAFRRVAGDALNAGGYKRKFKKIGNDLTTLIRS